MNSKMIIIAVVAVAVVVICAAALVMTGDKDDSEPIGTDARLLIYGNANNDDTIDSKDLSVIEDIIKKNSDDDGTNDIDWKEVCPLADVNTDGNIDSKDVSAVKDLIDRKEGITVYYIDGDNVTDSVKYPVKTACALGTATFTAVQSLGITDKIVGRSGTAQTQDTIYADIYSKPAVSSSMIDFDMSLFSNVASNTKGGVDAIIQNNGGMGKPIDTATESTLNKLGTKVITMKIDVKGEDATYLTLGFLCGVEENAAKVVSIMDGVYDTVDNAVKKAGKKPSVLCAWITGSMGTGMYATNTDAVAAFVTAAGGDLAEIPDGSMDISPGTVGILDEKYNKDFILSPVRTSITYDSDFSDWVNIWKSTTGSTSNLSKLDACPENMYIMMYGMPFIAKVAYSVEVLYPDYVSSGYGNDIHQQWVNLCYLKNLGSNYKVKDHGFFLGNDDFILPPEDATVYATDVTLSSTSTYIFTADQKTLTTTLSPSGSILKENAVWSSSDTSVATVSDGTITAVAPGTANITFKSGDIEKTCEVTVKDTFEIDFTSTAKSVGADSIAQKFIDSYKDDAFGTYTIESADGAKAVLKSSNVASMGGNSGYITIYGTTSAKDAYEASLYGSMDQVLGMPGEYFSEVTTPSGLDGFVAFKHEAPAMSPMTLLYFSCYVGDIYIDGCTCYQLHRTTLATEDQISAILDAIAAAVA